MIEKKTADVVNHIFEHELWKHKKLVCGVCKRVFAYEPDCYTYPDGQQTICCGQDCWRKIRNQEEP